MRPVDLENRQSEEKTYGKEVTKMNYTKPEIVLGGSALASIQGSSLRKPFATVQDSSPMDHNKDATAAAYEADE